MELETSVRRETTRCHSVRMRHRRERQRSCKGGVAVHLDPCMTRRRVQRDESALEGVLRRRTCQDGHESGGKIGRFRLAVGLPAREDCRSNGGEMNQDTLTLVGAIGGSVIGVLGGVVGTWCSIRNTGGPRERAFMIRVAVCCWLAVTAFLAALWLIPFQYEAILCVPEILGLHFAIKAGNRRLAQIRKEDSGAA